MSGGARRGAGLGALLADGVVEGVGHAQWVFTVPEMLRFLCRQRELLGDLSRLAHETVGELMAAAAGEQTLTPGMVSVIQTDEENVRRGGVLLRDGKLDRIKHATVEADYEDNGLYHRSLVAKVETEGGETLEIHGTVKGFIPLRNRREGLTTHIGEGMTEWKLGDRTGYGLAEFLRQVE